MEGGVIEPRAVNRLSVTVAGLSRRQKVALVVGGALLYSAVAVAVAPWTWYSRIFTAIPGAVAVGIAVKRGWHRLGEDKPARHYDAVEALGLMWWALLVTVTVIWILAIFFSHPREVYPTLSHLMNIVFDNYAVRVGGFFAWLALGWYVLGR